MVSAEGFDEWGMQREGDVAGATVLVRERTDARRLLARYRSLICQDAPSIGSREKEPAPRRNKARKTVVTAGGHSSEMSASNPPHKMRADGDRDFSPEPPLLNHAPLLSHHTRKKLSLRMSVRLQSAGVKWSDAH